MIRKQILLTIILATSLVACTESKNSEESPISSSSPQVMVVNRVSGEEFLKSNLPDENESAWKKFLALPEQERDVQFRDVINDLYKFTNSYPEETITKLINKMLPNVKNIDIQDPETKLTPLLIVAERSSYLVKPFIEKGADINQTDPNGRNSLMKVAARQDLQTLKYLIDKGANVKAVDMSGDTVLGAALQPYMNMPFDSNINEIISLLTQNYVDVNQKGSNRDSSDTALCLASLNGLSDVVDILIKYGADVNGLSSKGDTPLMCAAQTRINIHDDSLLKIFSSLINMKADLNIQNINGDTVLHLLLRKNIESQTLTPKAIQLLVQKGSNIEIENKKSERPRQLMEKIDNKGI